MKRLIISERLRFAAPLAILFLLALAVSLACGTTSADTGSVEVRVTDAPPGNVTSILVTTDQIDIHMANAGNQSGWDTVFGGGNTSNASEASFDLCQLMGIEEVIAYAGEVPAGKYNQVRMHVVSCNVTVDGEARGAKVPSDWIKVVRPFEVTGGNTTTLTFDFDAQKSVVVTGSGKVHFKPVIKMLVSHGEGPTPPATGNVSPTATAITTMNISPTATAIATMNISPTATAIATMNVSPTATTVATANVSPTETSEPTEEPEETGEPD